MTRKTWVERNILSEIKAYRWFPLFRDWWCWWQENCWCIWIIRDFHLVLFVSFFLIGWFVVIDSRKKLGSLYVYVREDGFAFFFLSPKEKCNEWAKKLFCALFFLFSSSLINGRRRVRQMNFPFSPYFSYPIGTKEKRREKMEKKNFLFFSLIHLTNQKGDWLLYAEVIDQLTTSIDHDYSTTFFLSFFSFCACCRHAHRIVSIYNNEREGPSPSHTLDSWFGKFL